MISDGYNSSHHNREDYLSSPNAYDRQLHLQYRDSSGKGGAVAPIYNMYINSSSTYSSAVGGGRDSAVVANQNVNQALLKYY